MDNRTINQIRNNETKLINEMKKIEEQNKKYKEVIDNIKYYLEDSENQMSEDSTYTLMNFIKEVE